MVNHGTAVIFPKNTGNMSNASDKIDFKIYGDDMQTVEVELDPGETVVAEAASKRSIKCQSRRLAPIFQKTPDMTGVFLHKLTRMG